MLHTAYLEWQTSDLHERMEAMLTDESKLISINISSSNIIWLEYGKEAIIQGKAFDVRKIEMRGDQISLTGVFDHEEDQLMHLKKKEEEREKNKTGRWNNLVFYPMQAPIATTFTGIYPQKIKTPTAYIIFIPSSPYLLQDGPPPKRIG